MSGWPMITECRVCGAVAIRGYRTTCLISSRRTARGRVRQCHGALFRRHDLEDAVAAATTFGGAEAGMAMLAPYEERALDENTIRPRRSRS